MVETHPERRDRGDDFSLSGKRGHRIKRKTGPPEPPPSFRPGSRNPGQGKLQGKPCRRFPRHSGREAGIPGRESYRGSHAAVSLVIPAGKPESRAGKATGEAMPLFPSSFRPGSRNPVPWKAAPQSPEAPKPDLRLRAAVGQGQREGGRLAPLPGIR